MCNWQVAKCDSISKCFWDVPVPRLQGFPIVRKLWSQGNRTASKCSQLPSWVPIEAWTYICLCLSTRLWEKLVMPILGIHVNYDGILGAISMHCVNAILGTSSLCFLHLSHRSQQKEVGTVIWKTTVFSHTNANDPNLLGFMTSSM